MRKKLWYLVVALLFLVVAPLVAYWYYLPAFLIEKLPSNIQAKDATFDLNAFRADYFNIAGLSEKGCKKKNWLVAPRALVELKNWQPSRVIIERPSIFVEPAEQPCISFASHRQRASSIPQTFQVELRHGAINILDVPIDFSDVQAMLKKNGKKYRGSFSANDNFRGTVKIDGQWSGKDTPLLQVKYGWPDVSKFPARWSRPIGYVFQKGRLTLTANIAGQGESVVSRNRLLLQNFSARQLNKKKGLGALLSPGQVDVLQILKSKAGVIDLSFTTRWSKDASPAQIRRLVSSALERKIRAQVKSKLGNFMFWNR